MLALLAQLLCGIEHVQAGSAAHGTMGGTQLREVHAKAGAAMGALGDEALGHAAVRLNKAASLTQVLANAAAVRGGRLAAYTADAYPAVFNDGRVEDKGVVVGSAHLVSLFGQNP